MDPSVVASPGSDRTEARSNSWPEALGSCRFGRSCVIGQQACATSSRACSTHPGRWKTSSTARSSCVSRAPGRCRRSARSHALLARRPARAPRSHRPSVTGAGGLALRTATAYLCLRAHRAYRGRRRRARRSPPQADAGQNRDVRTYADVTDVEMSARNGNAVAGQLSTLATTPTKAKAFTALCQPRFMCSATGRRAARGP